MSEPANRGFGRKARGEVHREVPSGGVLGPLFAGPLLFGVAVSAAIFLKLVLLFTSQSMADGDEAVEGLMALHILRDGVHPIYPYGVRYGAGAGVEAHLASVFFAAFGPSSVALKAVGLCVWLVSGGFVFAIAKKQWGQRAGIASWLLWGFAPFAAQWSLKVSGGHNVAVALTLLAIWLATCRDRRYAAACILPLGVIAHPVVLPIAVGGAAVLLLRTPVPDRMAVAATLGLSACVALGLFWPAGEGGGVWNPAADGFAPGEIARALPRVVAGLFTANLNAQSLPGAFAAVVACVWALAVAWSLLSLAPAATRQREAGWLWLVASCWAALLIVRPEDLAARHLLPVLPILVLLLGRLAAQLPRGRAIALLAVLVGTGAAVQLREVASSTIHGAGPQGRGVDRQNVSRLVADLEREGVHHVYSGDGMLQWMLMFESQERIIARWREPLDRVPRYPREVDRARLAGESVRLVVLQNDLPPGSPQRFEIRPLPGRDWLERVFPLSPQIRAD